MFGGECFAGRMAREGEGEGAAMEGMRSEVQKDGARIKSFEQEVILEVAPVGFQKVFKVAGEVVGVAGTLEASATRYDGSATNHQASTVGAAQPTVRPHEFFVG